MALPSLKCFISILTEQQGILSIGSIFFQLFSKIMMPVKELRLLAEKVINIGKTKG